MFYAISLLKKHLVQYELYFKKYLNAARVLLDEPEQSASERCRENAYYERYCLIQVTYSVNSKGQTWNEKI